MWPMVQLAVKAGKQAKEGMKPGRAETTLQKKATKRKDFGYEKNIQQEKVCKVQGRRKRGGKELKLICHRAAWSG